MRTSYLVTIYSENKDGTIHTYTVESDTLTNATRVILTYRSKRGYKMFSFRIDRVETLV